MYLEGHCNLATGCTAALADDCLQSTQSAQNFLPRSFLLHIAQHTASIKQFACSMRCKIQLRLDVNDHHVCTNTKDKCPDRVVRKDFCQISVNLGIG